MLYNESYYSRKEFVMNSIEDRKFKALVEQIKRTMEYKNDKYRERLELEDLEAAIRYRHERNELESVLIAAEQIDRWEGR